MPVQLDHTPRCVILDKALNFFEPQLRNKDVETSFENLMYAACLVQKLPTFPTGRCMETLMQRLILS